MVPAQTDGVHPHIRRGAREREREEMQKNKKIDGTTEGRKNVRERKRESLTGRRKHRDRVGGCRKRRWFYNYTSFTDQHCMYNWKMKNLLYLFLDAQSHT